MPESLYLIDGHYQIYRSFYAAPQRLSTRSGEPTGAIHVFLQMLMAVIKERRPDYLAVMMDVSDETVFRCDIDANYKAQRDPAPEGLHSQADRIISIIESLGMPLHRLEGYEADDLMATTAEQLKDKPIDVFFVSRDKDLEQLIGDRVRMFDPTKGLVIDAKYLAKEKGYTPAQAVDIQTLTGDSTDNIPGVPGVGLKTAAKLIAKYGSAEAVLDRADELTPKMSQRVREFAEQLPITRQLVTLRRDVPFTFDLAAAKLSQFRVDGALPILAELELSRTSEQLGDLLGRDSASSQPSNPITAAKPSGAATMAPSSETPAAIPAAYELVDTDAKLEAFAKKFARQSQFAFDTETTGLNPVTSDVVGLSISWETGTGYYVALQGLLGKTVRIDSVRTVLGPIFANADVAKIGHNLKYDVLALRSIGIPVQGLAFDTLIASFLLEPLRSSHSLDALAKSLFDHDMIPISDLIGKGRKQITMAEVDIAHVAEYAAEDADFTWRLYEHFAPLMKGSHVERLFVETEMPLVEVLIDMQMNGMAIDRAQLAELSKSLAARMEQLEHEVCELAGHPFNVASTKQLAEVLFDEQGLTPVRKTKTGRSTDADTLEALAHTTDNPIPPLVLEYRELSKLKGTYVDTLPKMVWTKSGRIHASFHQTGAVTGRLSSSDPNLQNIPIRTEMGRRIRTAFVAQEPDHVLLAADYSQIELRLLAHFCQDEALLDAFIRGMDVHRAVAAQVNGIAEDEVTPQQRSAAKAVNFGIIYGQTAFGLARSLSIPVGEARAFIDMYFMRYPNIRMFIDECVAKARALGYAETMLGRRRPIPELQSRNRQQVGFGERIAVNTVVQGSAADMIKRAMVNIHRELEAGDAAARMVSQVHDELVFELPAERAETESRIIRQQMETAMDLNVPIVVDISWGRSWADGK